jgi:threonine dehydrogenase-like Zn-dependent dehydrogenase
MQAVGAIPKKKEVAIIDHPKPVLSSDNEVIVKSIDVGICGTDREICTFVYGDPPKDSDYLVLGHECLGIVQEVGSAVENFLPGDLVVPSVRRPCTHNHCAPCKDDMQDFCSTGDFVERGIKMRHGYMTEYWAEEEKYLNYVPVNLKDVAVLVEPLTIVEKAMAQVWPTQCRLPWAKDKDAKGRPNGKGLNAVVLGAGPVGILGAMKLKAEGFNTFVYSRSKAPNPKAELVESFGVPYISAQETSVEELAERVGNIDLVYEAVGVASISYKVLSILGLNGIYVFTGIPAPKPAIEVDADLIMRNLVLKNQVVIGTVNADQGAFISAIKDLGIFMERWPEALKRIITSRFGAQDSRSLLLDKATGIKNVINFDH